jgi:hypothetical protein
MLVLLQVHLVLVLLLVLSLLQLALVLHVLPLVEGHQQGALPQEPGLLPTQWKTPPQQQRPSACWQWRHPRTIQTQRLTCFLSLCRGVHLHKLKALASKLLQWSRLEVLQL